MTRRTGSRGRPVHPRSPWFYDRMVVERSPYTGVLVPRSKNWTRKLFILTLLLAAGAFFLAMVLVIPDDGAGFHLPF